MVFGFCFALFACHVRIEYMCLWWASQTVSSKMYCTHFNWNGPHFFYQSDNWTQRRTMSLLDISAQWQHSTLLYQLPQAPKQKQQTHGKKFRHQIRWMAMVIAGIRMRFVLFMSASMAFWLVKWDAVLIKLHFYVRQNGNNPCNDGHHYYFIFEWEMSNSEEQRWTVVKKKRSANT